MWVALAVLLVASCVSARESLHADQVKDLHSRRPELFSNNILEDALLDVPDLITKYGYPVEVRRVITSDGYILELHRIPHGRNGNTGNRTPVLVMHGMFGSSADWVIAGPGKGLAYILADAGYDVWLGNARGTYYSRNHAILNPDEATFWGFSWDEIGRLDLPAFIDTILAQTGQPKLHYVAHSQGGTTFFVLNSLRPEYNDKIISFQGMAPAVFNSHANRPALEVLAPHMRLLELALQSRGIYEMFPNSDWITDLGFNYCSEDSLTSSLCGLAFQLFAGDSDQLNATMIPLILGHTPAGASFRQISHFGQVIATGQFRRYNYGSLGNIANYGRLEAPEYDLSKVVARVYLHYGPNDQSVHPLDLARLDQVLPNSAGLYRVEHDLFTHIDFLYGTRADELIYNKIVQFMGQEDAN